MKIFISLLACFASLGCLDKVVAESRLWTNSAGKQVAADLVRVENDHAVLLLINGTQAKVPLASLSAADQAWIKEHPAEALGGDDGRLPWDKRFLPGMVQESLLDMNIKVVKELDGSCIYESGHFRFKTTAKLGVLVMNEVCRAFESTYELVRRLPWGVMPKPEEGRTKFQAELFETRAEYLNTGAPQWSGGVYMLKDKVFRMPFEELGLTRAPRNKASGYTRSGSINNDTITHEITHQIMHEYLPFAPVWLLEGTAEYTAHLPYASGQFNVAGAVKAFKDMREAQRKPGRRRMFRGLSYSPSWIGVKELWGFTSDITRRSATPGNEKSATKGEASANLDPKVLASRYYSSHALVLYFMHLDGNGDAARLKKYFDAIHQEKARWTGFWPAVEAYNKKVGELRPAYAAYRKAMADFMKLPGVEDLGGGRFSYPKNLTPPVAPPKPPVMPEPPDGTEPDQVALKHLDVLLDGRSLEQMEREVRSGFLKVGVTL
jgi:hypothetical protein